MKKQLIIYNDEINSYIDDNENIIKEALKDNEEDINNSNIIDEAWRMIQDDADYLKELFINFDNNIKYEKIIVTASLGLWYGRRSAFKDFKTLKDAFCYCIEDYNKAYFINKNSTLNLEAAHHDGVNLFKFYKVVNNKKYAIKFEELMEY